MGGRSPNTKTLHATATEAAARTTAAERPTAAALPAGRARSPASDGVSSNAIPDSFCLSGGRRPTEAVRAAPLWPRRGGSKRRRPEPGLRDRGEARPRARALSPPRPAAVMSGSRRPSVRGRVQPSKPADCRPPNAQPRSRRPNVLGN